jgi:hypothetical protein
MADRMPRKPHEEGSSREKGYSLHRDLLIRRANEEEIDRSKKEQFLKELQESLSRVKMYLEIKNKKQPNWRPTNQELSQWAQNLYSENLQKVDWVEQSLPKLLLKEAPEKKNNIINGIKMLDKLDFEKIDSLNMYHTIGKIYDAMQRLFPDDPEGSSSKGSDTVG